MQFTYYGHSCFAVKINDKDILFDPFVSPNELAMGIDVTSIKADYIFLSHGHEDHIADCVAIAQRTEAKVVCNFEIHLWLNQKGVTNTHPMNTGGKWKFDFGTVKCVVAQHSSALPDGTYGGNPMGFVITSNEGNFYYSGDTALTLDMQLVPKYASLDFAVLPIGDNFTMDAADAVTAAGFIDCKKIVGVHYDTFGYIKIDQREVKNLFLNEELELLLLKPGEVIEV